MTFGSSYQEVWKNDGSSNHDSTVLGIKCTPGAHVVGNN